MSSTAVFADSIDEAIRRAGDDAGFTIQVPGLGLAIAMTDPDYRHLVQIEPLEQTPFLVRGWPVCRLSL